MKQRKRQIDPDFFHDRELARLKPNARLLFIGLWTLADRKGCLPDHPEVIKGLVFPFEARNNVDSMLSGLVNKGLIARYKVDNKGYIWIKRFERYQSIHPHEAQSVIPLPDNVIKCNDIQRQAIHGQYVDVDVKVDVDVRDKIPFGEIITDLNNRAGTKYVSTTEHTRKLIRARWKEGFTLDDFKTVHRKKVEEWLNTDMSKFLRPKTLYAGGNFQGYLNQQEKKEAENPFSKTQREIKDAIKEKYGID